MYHKIYTVTYVSFIITSGCVYMYVAIINTGFYIYKYQK